VGSDIWDYPIQRGIASLKRLPPPDILDVNLPAGFVCLITDDGTLLTPTLVTALNGRNWKVIVLSLTGKENNSQYPLPENVQRVILEEMSEENLQNVLEKIGQSVGPIGAVIHLNPTSYPQTGDQLDFQNQEKMIVKHIFLLAKYLKESLNLSANKGRGIFVSVTHLDGQFGLSRNIDFDPISGGLFGLVKTLNLEWEPVFCRAIDLTPEFMAEEATEKIMAELFDPNRLISEVGYSSLGRATLVVEQVQDLEVHK